MYQILLGNAQRPTPNPQNIRRAQPSQSKATWLLPFQKTNSSGRSAGDHRTTSIVKRSNEHPTASRGHLCLLDLNALGDAIRLARVDLLARLGNRLQDLVVREALVGDDGGRLALKRDLVGLDTCCDKTC